jgi:uncharacterized delta-60 repeat protein
MAHWPRFLAMPIALAALARSAGSAMAAPGDLDSSFDGDGKLTFAPGGKKAEIDDVAIQPDGKLVLAGWIDQDGTGGNVDFLVVRLNPNGSFDPGFGSGGVATVNFTGKGLTSDTASAVAVQPDGKIVVGGTTHDSGGGGTTNMAVVRLNSNGTPDATFNPAGFPHEGPDPVGQQVIALESTANDLVLDALGRILLAGSVDSGGPYPDAFVLRLTRSGEQDTSFNGGSAILHFDFLAHANSVSRIAVQPDGKIVAAGWSEYTDGDREVAVARIVPGAVEDEGFGGTDGEVYYGFGSSEDAAQDLVIQPDGKIDVAGYGGPDHVMVVSRLTSAGELEKSLGGQSSAFADFGGTDTANAVALQPNGRIVLGGGTTNDMALVRFEPNGLPDASFGPGGKRTVSFPGGNAEGFAMLLQGDGKIVLAGHAGDSAAVIRLEGDATGGGPGGGGSGATRPKLSRLKLSPTAFAAARSGPSAKAARTGTKVSFQLSGPASVTFTVERPTRGRRVGRTCKKPSSRNRRGRRCTRYVRVRGSFKRTGVAGANSFRFTGRMNRHALKPGRYRLVGIAKAGSAKSQASRAGFRITRSRH